VNNVRRRPMLAIWGIVLLFICAMIGLASKTPSTSTTNSTLDNTINQASAPAKAPVPTRLAAPTITPDIAVQQPQAAGILPSLASYYYAPETSHSVSAFADIFNQLGAVYGFGLPLTEPFVEAREATSSAYWVQYFEKAVIEYHPEFQGADRYQLTALGAMRLQEKYPNGIPSSKALPGKTTYTFPETDHTVKGAFLARWHEGGELRRFGYPLTESFEEVNEAGGQRYIVQYFERGEMQYHPKEKSPQDVQLVPLGAVRLSQDYPQGAPFNASQAIPSPTVNAPATTTARNAIAEKTQVAKANAQATITTAHANSTATALARQEAQQQAQQSAPGPFIPYAGNGGGPTQCNDGMWSHSSGRGTCSHHGGIKR
jgi:hypothetical protein